MKKSNIGVIGLAVMGENLALNIERNGYQVSVFNRSYQRVDNFIHGRGFEKNFYGARTIEEFCNSLESPKKIMLMVKAGDAVDATIETLLPYLQKGDILIDGGNSNYLDTERRVETLNNKGILFVGSGVSGGEFGALHGPSIMPGGNVQAWNEIKPIFESIAAKAGKDNNHSCTTWIGNGGAGHFVKMVHNGIEYGDMQIICEGYDIARKILKMNNGQISKLFREWNNERLSSYLIEITADILEYKEGEEYIVDKILDKAGQKGTGKWTSTTALEYDIPLNLITESVFSRHISALKEFRCQLSSRYKSENNSINNIIKISEDDIEGAIYAAKLISYAQGFELITTTSQIKNWGVNAGELAQIWRGGCIIRSIFLDDITNAYRDNSIEIKNLLESNFYQRELPNAINSLRNIVATAALNKIPISCLSSALSYYDAITSQQLPANLLQAQRDYFGAHTYERIDAPSGKFFHTNWSGEGGDTVSTVYQE